MTAGAPISYFGILSLVYYDAKSGQVYTLNAEWNTVRGETSAATIPGSINMASPEGLRGTAVSGRTALVGGFLKGVGAAHKRFGKLPFARLFDSAIYVADHGMPVTNHLADKFAFRHDDLSRLPATRAILLKAGGAAYRAGETFRQPALAATLKAVAAQGTDYIYKGPWAKKLVAAVQADGGVNMIEAQQLALASGLATGTHWTKSGAALKSALDITQLYTIGYLPDQLKAQVFPGVDFTPTSRTSPAYAAARTASH